MADLTTGQYVTAAEADKKYVSRKECDIHVDYNRSHLDGLGARVDELDSSFVNNLQKTEMRLEMQINDLKQAVGKISTDFAIFRDTQYKLYLFAAVIMAGILLGRSVNLGWLHLP
jgi:hypothetical protein